MIKSKEYTVAKNLRKYYGTLIDKLIAVKNFEARLQFSFVIGKSERACYKFPNLSAAVMFMYSLYEEGLCKHYFLDKELTTFLEGAVKLDKAQEDASSILYDLADADAKQLSRPICLHFQKSSGLEHSVLVSAVNDKIKGFAVNYGYDGGIWDENLSFDEYKQEMQCLNCSSEFIRCVKIVVGFLHYIHAFPETVVPHRPDVMCWKKYDGKRYELNVHPKIQADIESSISPHYRRGHLRFLQSDRFKNKKGQTVWVEGCFVKGKAFDVLSPEECV